MGFNSDASKSNTQPLPNFVEMSTKDSWNKEIMQEKRELQVILA